MKPNYKFVRVVLGSVVGALLWAGCASDRDIANEPAGAQIIKQRQMKLDRQENMTIYRGDTHPEWRTGWNMAFPNPPYDNPRISDLHNAMDQPFDAPPETR
jgi:hypothetical protein